MSNSEEIIKLESAIEVLVNLPYTTAFTGTLGKNVTSKTYVVYSDITKIIGQKRKLLAKLKKK